MCCIGIKQLILLAISEIFHDLMLPFSRHTTVRVDDRDSFPFVIDEI